MAADVDAILRRLQVDLDQLGSTQGRLLGRLELAARMRRQLDDLVAELVVTARKPPPRSSWWNHGQSGEATWEEVGQALGVSKQSAQRRYAGAVEAAYGGEEGNA